MRALHQKTSAMMKRALRRKKMKRVRKKKMKKVKSLWEPSTQMELEEDQGVEKSHQGIRRWLACNTKACMLGCVGPPEWRAHTI